jgi:hypothetical protein
MANAKVITSLLVILVIAIVGLGVYFVWSNQQQTAQGEKIAQTTSTTPTGKPATVSINAYDKASTTQAQTAALLYVIKNPTVTADGITGTFVADGSVLSATARTDISSGLNTGDTYLAIASNNTYFSDGDTTTNTINSQSSTDDVYVYKAANSFAWTINKVAGGSNLNNVGTDKNLSLGASETASMNKIEITINQSGTAANIAGLYFDKALNTNISVIDVSDGYTGSPAITKANIAFASNTNADVVFTFDKPVLIKSYGKVTLSDAIKLTANGNGCGTGETLTVYAFDKIWIKSSVNPAKMIYAYESDSTTSPLDIGITNPSQSIKCSTA